MEQQLCIATVTMIVLAIITLISTLIMQVG